MDISFLEKKIIHIYIHIYIYIYIFFKKKKLYSISTFYFFQKEEFILVLGKLT